MLKKALFIVYLVSINFCSQAQDSNAEPEGFVKQFFEILTSKGSEEAVSSFFRTNKYMSVAEAQINTLASRLGESIELLGEFYTYELITKAELNESYKIYSYLVKFDRQPLRFNFSFYRPNDTWVAMNFEFNDSFDEELKEAIKLYRLPISKTEKGN